MILERDKKNKVRDNLPKCQTKRYREAGSEINRSCGAASKELHQLDDSGTKTLGDRLLFRLCSACEYCEPVSLNEVKPSMLACLVPAATLGDTQQVIFLARVTKGQRYDSARLGLSCDGFLVGLVGGRCGGSKGRRRLHGGDDGVLGASAVGSEGFLEILQAQSLDDTGTHRVA